jgi:uncharacterized protein (TIGR02246 family)
MRRWLLLSLALTACASGRLPHAETVMQPVDAFVAAMTSADIEALAAVFDDDATVFMPFDSLPRRLEGKAEIRAAFGRLFDQVRKSQSGPPYMKLEPHDVKMQIFSGYAVITFHLGAVPAEGATSPSSFSRRTFIVHPAGGRWLVSHLHASNLRLQPPAKDGS